LASEFFLSNELPSGGWPATVTAAGSGAEYSEVDGEVVRAMPTLFSTPAGADVSADVLETDSRSLFASRHR
jgi:hypothetical protein